MKVQRSNCNLQDSEALGQKCVQKTSDALWPVTGVSGAMISLYSDTLMIPGVDKCINSILHKQVGTGTSEGLDDYSVSTDCRYWPPGHTDT